MDPNVIQCPTCSKKYRLPDQPPATFECRNCGTVMDLSAFAGEAAVPAPPAPPAKGGRGARGAKAAEASAPSRGGAPRRHRRSGAPRGRSHARGRRGRGREAAVDPGYDEGEERPRYQRKKDNTALIFGSLALVVVAVIVLVIFMMSQQKPEEQPKEKAEVPAYQPPPQPSAPTPDLEEKKEQPKPKVAKGREDEKRPELREGSLESIPIPEGKRKYRPSRAEIQAYPWPEHVTPEERNKIEEAIATFEWGGRDMMDAEEYLVALDARSEDGSLKPGEEFKAVGRLITEFKNLYDEFGGNLTSPEVLSRMMVVDRVLRRIDGMQERDFSDRQGIRAQSTDRQALGVIKRWNWWYDLEKWRKRRPPWDPAEDLMDPESMEGETFGEDEELPPR